MATTLKSIPNHFGQGLAKLAGQASTDGSLKSILDNFRTVIGENQTAQLSNASDIDSLENSVSAINANVETISGNVLAMSADVVSLETSVATLETKVAAANWDYARISGMSSGSSFTVAGMASGDEIIAAWYIDSHDRVATSVITAAPAAITWGSSAYSGSGVAILWRDIT